MISLFIDTSVFIPTISIVKDDKILFEYHEEIKNDMSSKILPIIDNALENTNLQLNSIDKIFVVNGPGSFTGVRIGVTIAKTLGWALKKDIITLSSLEFIASTNTDKKYLIPMIDARRGNVFGGIYDYDLNCIKNDSLIPINDILNELNDSYEIVSYDSIKEAILPKPDVVKIINKHKNDACVNAHELKPNYLKLTEAEENRKNKLKND